MAEKLNIPKRVVDSNWKDDVDVDYAIYGDSETAERQYVSPAEVSKESISRIKQRKLGRVALFTLKEDKLVA